MATVHLTDLSFEIRNMSLVWEVPLLPCMVAAETSYLAGMGRLADEIVDVALAVVAIDDKVAIGQIPESVGHLPRGIEHSQADHKVLIQSPWVVLEVVRHEAVEDTS